MTNRSGRNDRMLSALERDRLSEKARQRNQAEQQLLASTLEKINNNEEKASKITKRITDDLKSTLQELSLSSGRLLSPGTASKSRFMSRRASVDSAMLMSLKGPRLETTRCSLPVSYDKRRTASFDSGNGTHDTNDSLGERGTRRRGSVGAETGNSNHDNVLDNGEWIPFSKRRILGRRFSENDISTSAASLPQLKKYNARSRRASLSLPSNGKLGEEMFRLHRGQRFRALSEGEQLDANNNDINKSDQGCTLTRRSSEEKCYKGFDNDSHENMEGSSKLTNKNSETPSDDSDNMEVIYDLKYDPHVARLPEDKTSLINSWLNTTSTEYLCAKSSTTNLSEGKISNKKSGVRPGTPMKSRILLPTIQVSEYNLLNSHSEEKSFTKTLPSPAFQATRSMKIPPTPPSTPTFTRMNPSSNHSEEAVQKCLREARRKALLAIPTTYAALSRRRHSNPDTAEEVQEFGAKRLLDDMAERRKSDEENLQVKIQDFLQGVPQK